MVNSLRVSTTLLGVQRRKVKYSRWPVEPATVEVPEEDIEVF